MTTKLIGDYSIIKQVGQGSLGKVYLAEHRFMKRQYLLKVLPEELASDRTFVQRLEEDVASLSALEHPHIVKMHNVSFAQGQYFLVIDCIVDGAGETTNLAKFLQSHSLEEGEIFDLLKQVAEALDYAHSKQMIHRGIKLSNILVGESQHLYLTDFGLSRIIGVGAVLTRIYQSVAEALSINTASYGFTDQQNLLPLHASFLQSFAFLAPEQKRLDKETEVSTKSDNYAFGILAYYLLMREFPEGILEMPVNRKWNWDPLLQSCLHKEPERRPGQLLPVLESVKQRAVPQPIAEPVRQATPPRETPHPVAEEVIVKAEVKEEALVAAAPSTLKPVIKSAQIERPKVDPDPARAFHVDSTVKHYVPESKEVKDVEPILCDMVVIPGGTFVRGSNADNRDESPQHPINLDSFAVDVHPVTNEQFVRFLEVMGGEKDQNHQDTIRLKDSRITRSAGKLNIESGYSKHPVVGVTWYGASAYAKWVGKRLPTEAEWEVSAQGGIEHAPFSTGDAIEKTQANFFSSDTTGVMSYAPNGYGLYDMAGNVYEWCQDWYGYNYYELSIQEPENPKGPLQGVYRVLRGGCWKSLKEDMRCSRRHRNNPGTVNSTYGFRCAADVQE